MPCTQLGGVPLIKFARCESIGVKQNRAGRCTPLPGLQANPIGWHKTPAGKVADAHGDPEDPIGGHK